MVIPQPLPFSRGSGGSPPGNRYTLYIGNTSEELKLFAGLSGEKRRIPPFSGPPGTNLIPGYYNNTPPGGKTEGAARLKAG